MNRGLTRIAWPVSSLEPTFRAFLAELFALDPVFATGIGEHAHDATWPDMTAAGRTSRLAFVERRRATFEGLTELSPGGFGDTPGFRYRDHLESVIAHGDPPTALLRRILLD